MRSNWLLSSSTSVAQSICHLPHAIRPARALTISYIVVVKVGKPSETNRPGNRGKRDSQVLLMQYLNRVHFDAPMSPLELEIYHQMRNVIGIDPTFYEYIFQVDADTVRIDCFLV